MNPPQVCLCLMTYNHEKHLRVCLESILGQTFGDFIVVVNDDGSEDASHEIAREFAEKDPRVKSATKNERRFGWVANYRRTFEAIPTSCRYFAWVSGHDSYAPDWLDTLVRLLKADRDAVMAWPHTRRMDEDGAFLEDESPSFETKGLSLDDRIDAVVERGIGFGDMIYGLFSVEAAKRGGPFPKALLPDVLFLWRMCLFGTFLQTERELYYRRFSSIARLRPELPGFEVQILSLERQRKGGSTSKSILLDSPPYFAHALYLFQQTLLHPPAGVKRSQIWKLIRGGIGKFDEQMLSLNKHASHLSEKVEKLRGQRKRAEDLQKKVTELKTSEADLARRSRRGKQLAVVSGMVAFVLFASSAIAAVWTEMSTPWTWVSAVLLMNLVLHAGLGLLQRTSS